MVPYINLNVPEQLLIEESQKTSLSSFPSLSLFTEIVENLYGKNEDLSQKLVRIGEWLFSLQANHKELCTSILYGDIYHNIAMKDGLYGSEVSQPFFEERTSYFSNHAANLSFSLGDKLAQLVNVADGAEWTEDQVSLFKLVHDTTTPSSPYQASLTTLYNKRKDVKEPRHTKIHKYESELVKTKLSIQPGTLNGKEITVVVHGIDNIPITPYQNLQKSTEFESVFIQVLTDILYQICKNLILGYEEELLEIIVYKTAMGESTDLSSLFDK